MIGVGSQSPLDEAREDLLELENPLLLGLSKVELRRKRPSNRSSEFTWRNGLQLELQHSLLEPPASQVPGCTFNEFSGHGQLVSYSEARGFPTRGSFTDPPGIYIPGMYILPFISAIGCANERFYDKRTL